MSIKPIPTSYRGYRFRSRLEARWAVFMDHAGISDWRYETQGFLIGSVPYLPDFYLPSSDAWIEVKGAAAELDYDLMLAAPACLPGGRLLIVGPNPEPPEDGNWAWLGLDAIEDEPDACGTWLQFGEGGLLGYASETSSAPPEQEDGDRWLTPILNMVSDTPPRIIAAYRAARSARFEHNESGAS